MGGGHCFAEREGSLAVGDTDCATGGVLGLLGEKLVGELELRFLDAMAFEGLFFVNRFGY